MVSNLMSFLNTKGGSLSLPAAEGLAEAFHNPKINLTDAFNCIMKAFQNPIWSEQARERLKEIKMLTNATI